MDQARRLVYSEFFAQLQSAQDLLAERLGVCLVLVDREGREMTLPSGLPLLCYEHEDPKYRCVECHATLISKLPPDREYVAGFCPYGMYQMAIPTSIRTDDGDLFLLAGRTVDREQTEAQVDLLKVLYSLPFETPFVAKRAPGAQSSEFVAPHATLTQQEKKVLACVVAGLHNKEIGDRLCISQSTVKAHVANILKKLNLSNRTEASVYALKNGLNLEAGVTDV